VVWQLSMGRNRTKRWGRGEGEWVRADAPPTAEANRFACECKGQRKINCRSRKRTVWCLALAGRRARSRERR